MTRKLAFTFWKSLRWPSQRSATRTRPKFNIMLHLNTFEMDLPLVSRILMFLASYSQARVSFEFFDGIEILKIPGNQVWFWTKTQRLKSKKKLIDFTVHNCGLGQINNLHDSVTFRQKNSFFTYFSSLYWKFSFCHFSLSSHIDCTVYAFPSFLYREIKREQNENTRR